tara:strand:+ start:162 stop:992 length:831 start_codon:yes stop_codon:yes gene_type:complete
LPLISSKRNPLVRKLKSLSKKTKREEHSSLLLEGSHLLEEALKTNCLPLEVIATAEWFDDHQELLKRIAPKASLTLVTKNVLEASLSTVTPDGVAAIFPLSGLPKLKKKPKHILALDRIQDPGNLGNLFRSALAAEYEVIWLASGADPLNQKVLRSSAGSILHLPFERMGDSCSSSIEMLVSKLNTAIDNNYQVIGTILPNKRSDKNVKPYWNIDWELPTVLVLGNEGSGVHSSIQACCTEFVTLPHSSLVDSLNVASAAVPLLLERHRVKMVKGI